MILPFACLAGNPTYDKGNINHGNDGCDGFSPNFPLICICKTKHSKDIINISLFNNFVNVYIKFKNSTN